MRIPFLRPKSAKATPERVRPTTVGDDPAEIQAARTQARRRLVGAVVLLLIGVVGFPVLFETQPRPLPIDTPIEVPRRDTVASGLIGKDSPAPQAQRLPMLPADAGTEEAAASAAGAAGPVAAAEKSVASAAAAQSKVAPVVVAASPVAALAAASATAVAPARATVPTPSAMAPPAPGVAKASAPLQTPAPAPAAKPVVTAVAAPAAPPEKPAATATPPAESGRFVVQAGAYSEAGKLREARAKLEKLGLKTYTQVVESDKGSRTRVRVGPYASRAEAEAVAAQVKRSGVPAAVLAL